MFVLIGIRIILSENKSTERTYSKTLYSGNKSPAKEAEDRYRRESMYFITVVCKY